MIKSEPSSERFEALTRELLNKGIAIRFQAHGESMSPLIFNGETVHVAPIMANPLKRGDIVLAKCLGNFRVHRLVFVDYQKNLFITRGDSSLQDDPAISRDQILGVAVAKDVRVGAKIFRADFRGMTGRSLRFAARAQSFLTRLSHRAYSSSQFPHEA